MLENYSQFVFFPADDEDEQEVEKFESDRNSEEGSVYDSSDIERGYDSEENEILIPKNSNRNVKGLVSKTGKIRHEFVEAEAELSGSEEGSGDEDEKDLDEMDEEDGDAEDIDEEDLREGIVRHHVLKMNDADARDVRILQDGLLENGDLHGDGIMRERQFKWKHIGKLPYYWHASFPFYTNMEQMRWKSMATKLRLGMGMA